ncbi:hypothetical protein SDJN02_23435, partial [Cucurbita argyrosperma subsp. argyrosperma]
MEAFSLHRRTKLKFEQGFRDLNLPVEAHERRREDDIVRGTSRPRGSSGGVAGSEGGSMVVMVTAMGCQRLN